MGQWDNKTKGAWERLELTGKVVWCMEHIDAQTKCVRRNSMKHTIKLNRKAYAMKKWIDCGLVLQMASLKKGGPVTGCGCMKHVNAHGKKCIKRMSISPSLSLSLSPCLNLESLIVRFYECLIKYLVLNNIILIIEIGRASCRERV